MMMGINSSERKRIKKGKENTAKGRHCSFKKIYARAEANITIILR